MADGFFLGGVASGADTARQRSQRDVALAQQQQQVNLGERRLNEDVRLREQAQGLQQRALADAQARRDEQSALSIANAGITQMQQAVVTLRQQGVAPEQIQKVLTPVFTALSPTIARAGLDPNIVQTQLQLGIQSAPLSPSQQFQTGLEQQSQAAAGISPQASAAPAPAAISQPVMGATVPPALSPDPIPTAVIRPSPRAVQAATRLVELGDLAGGKEIIREDVKQQVAVTDPSAGRFKDAKQKFDSQQSLRKEFLAASSDFIKIRNAFERVQASEDTGAGDVSLIFNFMKMLDPQSTVREGEFATAEQTAGIRQRVVAQYNRAVSGERLTPTQRAEFKSQVTQLFKAPFQQHQKRISLYSGLAEANGLSPGNVAVNITGDFLVTPGGLVVRIKP